MITDQDFGTEIRHLRLLAAMTQREASDAAGVPLKTYRNWEYHRNTPSRIVRDAVVARIRAATATVQN